MGLITWILGRTRLKVAANERVLVLAKGRVAGIYGPGEHTIACTPSDLTVERFDLSRPAMTSAYTRLLFAERPDLAEQHLTVVQAREDDVVLAFRDGVLAMASTHPAQRHVLWTDAGPWDVQRVPLTDDMRVPAELHTRLRSVPSTVVGTAVVERGQVGLLSVDGVHKGVLGEGTHLYWKTGHTVQVRVIDTRWHVHDVTGQEVLTADRVTVRVNIAANYRVVDAVRTASAVKDVDEALHRALQLAFRRTMGTRTLDQLLAEKVTVDVEAAEKVRTEMAGIGLEVGDISLKDVILPGEMREILNRVVSAEKEAEANVIRRREETQATRSLLNTAKVMAENPVMLRLKELEALTDLADKVDHLTVHNGTEGLLNDLVKLRD